MSDLNLTSINPRLVEVGGKQLSAMRSETAADQQSFLLDRDWAKSAFLISDSELGDRDDIANRYWSSADAKFTDARLGCNIGINSRPQFTRYADIRNKGRLFGRNDVSITNTSGNYGMGRYYSEAIDDPAQVIYMRFGVPQFNSLTSFLARAFDPHQTTLAKTGRAPGTFYELGKAAGTIATVLAFPAIAVPLLAGKFIMSFFMRPTSKFYTLKPTMYTYWSTVDLLVNTLLINRGIFPKFLASEDKQRIGQPMVMNEEYLKELSKLMPDIFPSEAFGETTFRFDIYALSTKAQRIANQLFAQDYDNLNKGTPTDYTGYLKRNNTGDGTHATYVSSKDGESTLGAFLNRLTQFGYYQTDQPDTERMEVDPRIDTDSKDGSQRKDPSWFQSFWNYFDAEFRDGSQFVSFRVDHTGSAQEAFGNAAGESDLSQKLNGFSSQVREARFSFAEGNVLGETMQSALGAVKDLAIGALDGVTMGFASSIAGLAGSGYIDIPKHWQSSTATLTKNTYTIQLISPYGNPISQMINIYIPLCMLLAGALPRSCGKQSYTSPFLCQLFDRGRSQIKLGMIESLSITRGTSNLPFDTRGNALAIDVSFSVLDLSQIMHMPVSSGSILGADMTLDEDNILSDYLAVLAGMDLYSQVYEFPKAKLNAAKTMMKYSKLTSPAYWNSIFHDSATSGMVKYLTLGSFNVLEAFVRNPEITSGSKL